MVGERSGLALLTFLLPPVIPVTAVRALAVRAEEKRNLRLAGRGEGTELERVEVVCWALWKGLLTGVVVLVSLLVLARLTYWVPGTGFALGGASLAGLVRAVTFYRAEMETENRWRQLEEGAPDPA